MVVFLILLITVLLAVFAGLVFSWRFILNTSGSSNSNKKKVLNKKDKANILKSSNKKLAQNPKDPKALSLLSDLYYDEGDYDKAMRALSVLEELAQSNKGLDSFDITRKYAIALLKSGNKEEAYRAFTRADGLNASNFEVNFNLGALEYQRKNYDLAVHRLRMARTENRNHAGTVRYLGLAYYKMHRYKEGLEQLKKAIETNPEDKEVMFAIGQCYNSLGNKDQGLKIFTHLRADPVVGALACLYGGGICFQAGQLEEAIGNFEMGLKHQKISIDIRIELKYRMAAVFLQQQNLVPAIDLLKEIQQTSPNYKDVHQQIQKYADLIANKNLSIYLLSGNSEFANLCRKVCITFFPKAHVKVVDMAITQNQYLDIVAEVNTARWEDLVVFRFIRNTGQVSDLIIRELYSKIKEEKAGRGLCLTAGSFTEEAKLFVEARLIDLIERDDLEKRLKKIEPEVY